MDSTAGHSSHQPPPPSRLPIMKVSTLRLIDYAGAAAAGAAFCIGGFCFGVMIHDVTGPQRFDGRTISNLALAALIVPHAGVLPLIASGKASDKLVRLQECSR